MNLPEKIRIGFAVLDAMLGAAKELDPIIMLELCVVEVDVNATINSEDST